MGKKPDHTHNWVVTRTETRGKNHYVFYRCTICGETYMEINRSN